MPLFTAKLINNIPVNRGFNKNAILKAPHINDIDENNCHRLIWQYMSIILGGAEFQRLISFLHTCKLISNKYLMY